MSNICTSCSAREGSPAGKWYVRPSCVGRRDPPNALRDACVDNGNAPPAGACTPGATPSRRRNDRFSLDAASRQATFVDVYRARCDPTSVCKDILAASPWMAELNRASPGELRSAVLREQKHLAPANMSGLEEVLGQGGDIPSDGASFLFMTAPVSGAGAPA